MVPSGGREVGERSRGEKWWEESDGNRNNCTVEWITDLLHGNAEFRWSSKVRVGAQMPQLALWNSAELHLNLVLPCGKSVIPNCTVLSILSLLCPPFPFPPFHHSYYPSTLHPITIVLPPLFLFLSPAPCLLNERTLRAPLHHLTSVAPMLPRHRLSTLRPNQSHSPQRFSGISMNAGLIT